MKSASATESDVQREGVRAILLKAGLDPDRAWRTERRNCKTGEIIYTWTQDE